LEDTMSRSPNFVTDRHEHTAGTDQAAFSPCRSYRYGLTRRWASGPTACWVMLNPSKADAFKADPTIKRVIGFTQRIGCGGLVVVNLYALRSTKPDALWTHPDPIGPLGEQFLRSNANSRTLTIAAWGAHGARNGRGQQVADMLADAGLRVWCLGTTANGQPKHPLYVKGDTPLVPYAVKAAVHV
jgi:hypothetical protein